MLANVMRLMLNSLHGLREDQPVSFYIFINIMTYLFNNVFKKYNVNNAIQFKLIFRNNFIDP